MSVELKLHLQLGQKMFSKFQIKRGKILKYIYISKYKYD